MRVALAICAAALSLAACAAKPAGMTQAQRLQEAPVLFMGMAPLSEAAMGGKTVVRVFSQDGGFGPVVDFVAEPGGGLVTVTAVNPPANFGAPKISAPVDPELWKMALADFETLRSDQAEGRTLEAEIAAKANVSGLMVCEPVSWFLVADGRGVTSPGMPDWSSCANRQGAALPGLYGLALHSLAPCMGLEPPALDASGVLRCLRIQGVKGSAVALSNAVFAARDGLPEDSDDFPLILAQFAPDGLFRWSGGEAVGPSGLKDAWARLAPGETLRIGLSQYQGLSEVEVEVQGEAYYLVTDDASGRPLAPQDRALWFAAYHQIWVKGDDRWQVRRFVVEPFARAHGDDPMARFLGQGR